MLDGVLINTDPQTPKKIMFSSLNSANILYDLGHILNLKFSVSSVENNFEVEIHDMIKFPETFQKECCIKAYITGCFLVCGYLTNPSSGYHLEFKTESLRLIEYLEYFDLKPRKTSRKNKPLIYFKDGESISQVLRILNSYKSLMEFEDIRIMKEVRNNVNRAVNCDTANIAKITDASIKQIEDIEIIEKAMEFESLPLNLKEIAQLRKENPYAQLKELGEMLIPPIGKSGVSHRLKKISSLAEKIKARR